MKSRLYSVYHVPGPPVKNIITTKNNNFLNNIQIHYYTMLTNNTNITIYFLSIDILSFSGTYLINLYTILIQQWEKSVKLSKITKILILLNSK